MVITSHLPKTSIAPFHVHPSKNHPTEQQQPPPKQKQKKQWPKYLARTREHARYFPAKLNKFPHSSSASSYCGPPFRPGSANGSARNGAAFQPNQHTHTRRLEWNGPNWRGHLEACNSAGNFGRDAAPLQISSVRV